MERHHRAGSMVSFSVQVGNDIFFRFYLTKAELLALTPQDIDFDNKVIRITKSYQRLEGKDVVTDPKTPKSKRNVSMPDFLCEELKEYLGRLYGLLPTDRIFHLTKSFLHHEMTRGAGKAGVKRIRIHDLRHPYVKHKLKNLSDYWPDRLSAKDKPARPVFLLSFQVLFMLSQSLNP